VFSGGKHLRGGPVEPVDEPEPDGAQVRGVGDHRAVGGILNYVHRAGEGSGDLCYMEWEKKQQCLIKKFILKPSD